MKKLKKFITFILILGIIFINTQVFANSEISDFIVGLEMSEEFKEWLELPEEEKNEKRIPRAVDILNTSYTFKNPIKLAHTLGSSTLSKFDLRDYIPENLVVRNQMETNTCWAFASIGMLESNLGLADYHNNNTTVAYDFSERHMEYATTRTFKNGKINIRGFNRVVGDGGNYLYSKPYLLSGLGPINEADMPFENNENLIDISEIENKTVTAQVLDFIAFPTVSTETEKANLMRQMKEHIRKNGGIEAAVHGAQITSDYFNIETGAIYCESSTVAPANHDVVIIGWDDNYSVDNFNENCRPKENGAWIVKNSWGAERRISLEDMKKTIFEQFEEKCKEQGWNSAGEINDDFAKKMFEEIGYTIEGNEAVLKIGEDGYMYVSYEDANIYEILAGIEKASSTVDYDNVYQYDYYGYLGGMSLNKNKVYIATVFDKNTDGVEYLSKVGIETLETATCKVYVNPNGNSKAKSNLIQVELKDGFSKTFNAGYHTLEFLNPVEIKSDEFVVVVELIGTRSSGIYVPIEFKYENSAFSVVEIENGKTFWAVSDMFEQNQWADFAQTEVISGGSIPNSDACLKAFTTSEEQKITLDSIEITTPPTKLEYEEGQDFDKTGMVVSAVYSNGDKKEITDYTIKNGTDLKADQKTVIIEYEEKVVTQAITVKKKEETNPGDSEQDPDDGSEEKPGDSDKEPSDNDNKEQAKPEVSNFNNASANVKNVKAYYFTDKTKKEYITIDLAIEDIERSVNNDTYQYYYYLSSSPSEKNIVNWVKITESQKSKVKLEFTVNTKNISNYDDVSDSNNLYLYIKEIVKRDGNQKDIVTNAIALETEGKIEIYKDNVKQTNNNNNNSNNQNNNSNNNNSNNSSNQNNQNNNNNNNNNSSNNQNNDTTTANTKLPNAGLKIGIILTIIAISIFGIIKFIQYKNIGF